ncbi:MAG: glycosyltransferase family 2 protein [Thermoplasmata archaeon]
MVPDSAGPSRERRIDAGIAAFNEEDHIGPAIQSLSTQSLPEGVAWGTFWVVASGCTDRTVARARHAAPNVVVLEEPRRRGKSAAVATIFAHAGGDDLLLLDADARARRGALSVLLGEADRSSAPYAISGRPVLPASFPRDGFAAAVRLSWEMHHRFQTFAFAAGHGTTLSENLLLLSGRDLPPMPEGVINDGSFIAAWMRSHHGTVRYVPGAEVEIEASPRLAPYIAQRRRVRFGAAQLHDMFGAYPSSILASWARVPSVVGSMTRGACRSAGVAPARAWAGLFVAEVAAASLAIWDRQAGSTDHVRWVTLPEEPGA